MSKKDTLAWRAQGRGRRVLGPESIGGVGRRRCRVLLFSDLRMVLSPLLLPGRGLLAVVFLQDRVLGQDQINFILTSFSVLKTKQ